MFGLGIGKLFISLAIVAVAALGVGWWHTGTQMANGNQGGVIDTIKSDLHMGGSASTNVGTDASVASKSISASGSSDASLSNDLKAIDGQMNVATHDSASVDQSMNDQSVAQAQ